MTEVARVFTVPRRVVTGWGALSTLGREAARLGRRALLVTGRRFARQSGLTDRVVALLAEAGVEAVLYDRAGAEPTLEEVDGARRLLAETGCDLVVAIGGGSAIDVGKVAAGLAREEAPAREFQQGRDLQRTGIPMIAVPTTAGTGAEATPNGVITDTERRVKQSIRHPSFMPAVALVDPETTVGADRTVTAHSGLDALAQAVESHVSRGATAVTRALSRQAFVLLARALPGLARDLADRDARESAAMGSLMAGMALANARLGIVHGLAHPLGARFHIPHGRVCGILLPHVVRFNLPAAREGYAELEQAIGRPLAEFAEALLASFGVPADLEEYHIPPEDLREIADEALPSGSTRANPRRVSARDLVDLLAPLV